MKVLFLVQRFPGYGGAEEYVRQLVVRLSEKGIDCTIVTSNLDKQNASDLPKSVEVIKLPVILRIGEYAVWNGLIRTLLGSRADVFHVNTYGYFHADAACLLRRVKGSKLVFTSHGFHGLELFIHRNIWKLGRRSFRAKYKNLFRPFYDFTFGRNQIMSADALIALSRRDVDIYRWMGAVESKIYEIPLGVRDRFFEDANEDVVRKIRERVDGDSIILSVGELSWIKGKDILLRALPLIVKENPRVKLVLIGKDGGMYRYLRNLAVELGVEGNVLFLGYIPSDQLVQYYHAADVFVHTSYAEGLSTIVLEAMATGLPVVSTPAGGNAYLLQKSNAGIVVPFNDPNSVSTVVSNIVNETDLRKLLGSNGRAYAINNHRWDEIVKKYLSLYQCV